MNNPQYIYSMYKLSKIHPGGKQVIKDISLSFLLGAKIGDFITIDLSFLAVWHVTIGGAR